MAQRAPFVSLWSRDDVRTAIADFRGRNPVLPSSLSRCAVQTSLLVTAIRRRGKTTVPSSDEARVSDACRASRSLLREGARVSNGRAPMRIPVFPRTKVASSGS